MSSSLQAGEQLGFYLHGEFFLVTGDGFLVPVFTEEVSVDTNLPQHHVHPGSGEVQHLDVTAT